MQKTPVSVPWFVAFCLSLAAYVPAHAGPGEEACREPATVDSSSALTQATLDALKHQKQACQRQADELTREFGRISRSLTGRVVRAIERIEKDLARERERHASTVG